jgi:hypothetical protein
MRIGLPVWLALGLFAALASGPAAAAPQILAALPSESGIPFACAEGICVADLSTYCLQRDRSAPEFGAAYEPASAGAFTLVVTDASGAERRLGAADHVSFVEGRGFTAISARVAAGTLARIGAVSARMELEPNASLLPVAVIGDPDPLTPDEIARTVGPLRRLGARVVDANPKAEAAGVIGALANAAPRRGTVAPDRREPLWRQVTGGDRTGGARRGGAGSPGQAQARRVYDGCLAAYDGHEAFSFRGCLEGRHDALLRDLSVEYWNVGAGS